MSRLKIPIYLLLFVLLALGTSANIWMPVGLVSVIPGAGINAGAYFIKIHNVDPIEQIVTFTVKSRGIELDQGYVTFGEAYVIPNKVKIELIDFSEVVRYGFQARLRISNWIEGEFTEVNMPNPFAIGERYTTYATIKNTGSRETLFEVMLSQEGDYDKSADMFKTEGGVMVQRFLDLDQPSLYVRVPPGDEARVIFDNVVANRQTPKSGSSISISANLVFYLLANGQVLDAAFIPNVYTTNTQTGYIAEINIPKVLVRDVLYKGEAVLHNAGPAQGGIESDKFFFEERSGALNMDSYRFDIPAHSELRYVFDFRPKQVGKQTLNFEFSFNSAFNRKFLDSFQYNVEVVEGVSSYIYAINHPPEVRYGEQFDVDIVIKNLGPARNVNMIVSAPGFIDDNIEHFIALSPQSTVVKRFRFTALGEGNSPIIVDLIPHESFQNEGKNYDPYAVGESIHHKESNVLIVTPTVDGVSVTAQADTKLIFDEPPVPVPVQPVQEPVVYPQPVVEKQGLINPGLAVIIVLLVILILLIARLLWGPTKL